MQKKDLKDCTFIIPVKIESKDREFNFLRVIQYLCDTLDTNIIIGESDSVSVVSQLLPQINTGQCSVIHLFDKNESEIFHRTKILNQMISLVKTPVTVNYDVDCLLQPEVYEMARNRIICDGYDLIYPYGKNMAQIQIRHPNKEAYNGETLFNPDWYTEWGSLAGHIQFFKTDSYIRGGMENENFVSYGPEDRERMERFIKLGYKVDWCNDAVVYHLEHARGVNSAPNNPMFLSNESLYYSLMGLTKEQLQDYYDKQDYLKKYQQ